MNRKWIYLILVGTILPVLLLANQFGLLSVSARTWADVDPIQIDSPTTGHASGDPNRPGGIYVSWESVGIESRLDDESPDCDRIENPNNLDGRNCSYSLRICFDNEDTDENRCTGLSGTGEAYFNEQGWGCGEWRCYIGDIDQDKAYEKVGWGDLDRWDRESGVAIKHTSAEWDWTPKVERYIIQDSRCVKKIYNKGNAPVDSWDTLSQCQGYLDPDNDGVLNSNDNCPDTYGKGPEGCPYNDQDVDGVYDRDDKAPNTYGSNPDGTPTLWDRIINLFVDIGIWER